MSKEIEQRIVEMKFDNKGFANGVKDTLKSLDELEKGMQFKGGKEGIEGLQKSISGVEFNNIMNGINSINDNLEHMQSVGFRVFTNLINKATDWAEHMVKSLSVDRIDEGFRKYEDKTETVKTLVASLKEELGETAEDEVYAALQDLNNYSDATIYSFSDMTTAVKRFVNEGAGLDDSVTALKGLSNAAALAGASTENARTAMDQLSFSMSQGYVALRQWRSIARANIGNKIFRDQLIQTAVDLGTLVETEEGFVSTTVDGNGKLADAFTDMEGFTESLKSKWLTNDVLVETLARYADETTEFGQAAFEAATKVNTFHKMMTVLKEQVSTGWLKTFELLFGELEEATEFWSGINSAVGGFLKTVADTRNGILELWKAAGAHQDIIDGLKNIWTIVQSIGHYIGLALETIFGHRYLQNFDDVRSFFEDRENFKGNLIIIKKLSSFLIVTAAKFKELTDTWTTFFDYMNNDDLRARHFLEEIYQCAQAIIIPLRVVFRVVTGLASKWIPIIAQLAAVAVRLFIHLFSKIGYILTEGGLQEKLYALADFVVNVLGGSFSAALDQIKAFAETIATKFKFKSATDMLLYISDILTGVFFTAVDTAIAVVDWLVAAFSTLISLIGPAIALAVGTVIELGTAIKDFFTSNEEFVKLKENTLGFFRSFFGDDEKDAKKEAEEFKKTLDTLKEAGYSTKDATEVAKKSTQEIDGAYTLVERICAKIETFIATIKNTKVVRVLTRTFTNIKNSIKSFLNGLPVVKKIKQLLKPFTDIFNTTFGDIKLADQFKQLGDIFMNFFKDVDNIKADNLIDWIKGLGGAISNLALALWDFASSKLNSLITRVQDFWKKLFPKKEDVEGEDKNGVSGVVEAVKGIFSSIVETIVNFKWEDAWKLLRGLISVFVIKKLVDFFSATGGVVGGLNRIVHNIGKLIGNLADTIAMTKWEIAAEAFKTFATGVLELVAAVVILSLIPQEDLSKAESALFLLGLMALAFLYIKAKFIDATAAAAAAATVTEGAVNGLAMVVNSLKGALKRMALAGLIVAITIAVSAMAGLVFLLSRMTEDQWTSGFRRLASILDSLVGAVIILGGLDALANRFLGRVDFLGIAAALLGLSICVGIMAVIAAGISKIKNLDKGLTGIIKILFILDGALVVMGIIQELFGKLDLLSIAGSFAALAFGLTLMLVPITVLSFIPVDKLNAVAGMIFTIAVSVAGLFAVTGYMKKIGVGFKDLLGVMGSVAVLALGLDIFADALRNLCEIAPEVEKHWKTLLAVAGVIAVFVAAGMVLANFFPELIPLLDLFMGAILLLGAGVWLLGEGCKSFAEAVVLIADNMNTIISSVKNRKDDVVDSVSTIVYALVKGLTDGLVYMLAALIAGLDDAIKVIDDHAWSLGYHSGSATLKFLLGFIEGINDALADLPALMFESWMEGNEFGLNSDLWKYGHTSGEQAAEKMAKDTAQQWDDAQKKYVIPQAEMLAKDAKDAYYKAFEEYQSEHMPKNPLEVQKMSPEEKQAIYDEAIKAGQTAAAAFGDDAVSKTSEYKEQLDKLIEETFPKSGEAAKKAAEDQKEASESVVESNEKATTSTLDTMNLLKMFSGKTPEEIQNALNQNGPIDTSALYKNFGLDAKAGGDAANAELDLSIDDMYQKINEMGGDIDLSALREVTGIEIPNTIADSQEEANKAVDVVKEGMIEQYTDEDWASVGPNVDDKVASSIKENEHLVTDASGEVAEHGSDTIKKKQSKWKEAGQFLTEGLVSGIQSKKTKVINAASGLAGQALLAMKRTTDEKSPSKKTYEIGYYLVLGLVNGLVENDGLLSDAAEDSTSGLLGSIRQAMSNVNDIVDDELGYSPTISPVLDSSRIQYGLNNLNSLLNGSPIPNIGADLSVGKVDVGSAVGELNSITSKGNDDLLSELRLQAKQTERLIYLLENQKLYLDGRTVIGCMAPGLDSEMARRATLAGRRG